MYHIFLVHSLVWFFKLWRQNEVMEKEDVLLSLSPGSVPVYLSQGFSFFIFKIKWLTRKFYKILPKSGSMILALFQVCQLVNNGSGQEALFFFYFFFYCSGFWHTLKWISHGFTSVRHPDPPSHLPLHPIPLGLPSAPGPSACLMHPTWAGDLLHPR